WRWVYWHLRSCGVDPHGRLGLIHRPCDPHSEHARRQCDHQHLHLRAGRIRLLGWPGGGQWFSCLWQLPVIVWWHASHGDPPGRP
ncbi:hypothetical protein HaLaN_25627, partial [Haematococcus lacustris]